MNNKQEPTKENLLQQIEKLISYGRDENTINPDLLAYLGLEDLQNIKKGLEAKAGNLSDEDKRWLEQFKKYD